MYDLNLNHTTEISNVITFSDIILDRLAFYSVCEAKVSVSTVSEVIFSLRGGEYMSKYLDK